MNKTETEENYKVSPRDRRLEEIYDMTLENNDLLRSLLKREKIHNFFRILYWSFIIITALGFYYKFDDILNYVMGNTIKLIAPGSNLGDITKSLPEFNKLLELLNGPTQ